MCAQSFMNTDKTPPATERPTPAAGHLPTGREARGLPRTHPHDRELHLRLLPSDGDRVPVLHVRTFPLTSRALARA